MKAKQLRPIRRGANDGLKSNARRGSAGPIFFSLLLLFYQAEQNCYANFWK
jgi:hypothetical protein